MAAQTPGSDPARSKAEYRGGRAIILLPWILNRPALTIEKKTEQKISRADLMSYLMYPDVFLKFAKARSTYGNMEILPTPQFFYGVERGQEIAVELEPGKTLVVKLLTVSDPHPDGTRTIFFELNGQPREVTVRDRCFARPVRRGPRPTPQSRDKWGRRFLALYRASPWTWESR